MQKVTIAGLSVSRLILGSNPFSGFSHQGTPVDSEMKHYFTTERIKATLAEAESLGITTLIARVDHHISRVLLEYWDQGGHIQWLAQTCPEVGSHEACVNRAASGGAKACHIHGGVMDYLLAQKKLDEVPAVVRMIRDKGLKAGIAGHNPDVFRWAEDNLDIDYYMCSYYNASHRDTNAEHVSGMPEWFLEEDRQAMTTLIKTLSRPVVHYKVLAAGRNDPAQAFAVVARHLRPTDAVCVGVYPGKKPGMIAEDVGLFGQALAAANAG